MRLLAASFISVVAFACLAIPVADAKKTNASSREQRLLERQERVMELPACDRPRRFKTLNYCLPEGWKQRDQNAGIIPSLSFYTHSTVDAQPIIVLVQELKLPAHLPPSFFSAYMSSHMEGMLEYEFIDAAAFTFNSQNTILTEFNARFDEEKPLYRFFQLGAMNGKKGYLVSAALPLTFSEEDRENVFTFLGTMKFRSLRTRAASGSK